MTATLPASLPAIHVPTAVEFQQILDALTRITNIQIFNTIGGASLAASSSTTNVDVAGTSFAWSKLGTATQSDIVVAVSVSCYVSVAGTAPRFGINVGGTDFDVVGMIVNVVTQHTPMFGFAKLAGVAAGSYNPNVRFRRTIGTGTTTVDTGDLVSVFIAELPK